MLGSYKDKCTIHNSNNGFESLNIEFKGVVVFSIS